MEIKVRALDAVEPKGVQELEKELVEKHEQEQAAQEAQAVVQNEPESAPANVQEEDLSEEKVLSYIGKRYNKQISSFDELMAERKSSEELPEDVAAYFKYKKETGRGIDDFVKLKKNFDEMNPDDLLRDYIAATNEGLDKDDINVMLEEYSYDENLDDDSHIKKVKIAKKKAVAEAKRFFTEQQEKYKLPLESRQGFVPDEEKEEYEAYKQYTKQAKTYQEEENRRRDWFQKKTEDVFSGEFKGFEFELNNKKVKFAPGDSAELKKMQLNPANFISKFLDENGLIKDAEGYHRALAMAMNPDKFAKFFYEQGLADATDDVTKKIKNINMTERKAVQVTNKGDFQVKAVNPDSGKNLKIRSIKRI